jgi:hypothetical protein
MYSFLIDVVHASVTETEAYGPYRAGKSRVEQ